MTTSTGKGVHFKGLNGIRAIAAFSVLVSHSNESLATYGLTKLSGLDLAGFGVTMFFSLSGFLITYLLLLEKEKYGSIEIKEFYIRRILRIWPLYYLFLFLAVLALLIFERTSLTNSIWFYLVLFANIPFIFQTTIAILRHYWSLGVEEQFYLFWPWVIRNVSRLTRWIIVFISVLMLLKFASWFFYYKTGNNIPLSIIHVTRFHCMAIGALGAILAYKDNKIFKRISFSVWTQLISWLVIFLMAFNRFHIINLIDHEFVSVITVFLIMNVSQNQHSIIKLENPVMDYLGKISYGIYIYHPLFIFLGAKLLSSYFLQLNEPFRHIAIYIFIFGGTLLIAALSYSYFEKWFIRFKDKFTRIKSSPSFSSLHTE